jgi:hypothetical protein
MTSKKKARKKTGKMGGYRKLRKRALKDWERRWENAQKGGKQQKRSEF